MTKVKFFPSGQLTCKGPTVSGLFIISVWENMTVIYDTI